MKKVVPFFEFALVFFFIGKSLFSYGMKFAFTLR